MAAPNLSGPRVERVLDSAADLLARWGYQRVTIDEVARHAGIGKGTVYLHFRTKDALFLTVLLRVQRRVVAAMADRIAADPAEVLPARMLRAQYLDVVADPVTRPLYLADPEVLGRLAVEEADTLGELGRRRDEVTRTHLDLLREAGCLRDDLDTPALHHALAAVSAGFFFVDGLPGADRLPEPSARAALLERVVADALQVPDPPVSVLARVAPVVLGGYQDLIEHVDHEWRRRVR